MWVVSCSVDTGRLVATESNVLVAGGRSKAFGVLKDDFSKGSDSDTSAIDPRSDRQIFDIASPESNRKAMCLEVIQCRCCSLQRYRLFLIALRVLVKTPHASIMWALCPLLAFL